MMPDVEDTKQKLQEAVNRLHEELKKVRTGRANPAILDSIIVNAYGQPMPLKHVANIVASDAQMLTVTPFDPHNLAAISSAISESNIGLNPSDDGHVVRVPVPALNEERRKELVKMLGSIVEETKVIMRNIRHDALNSAKEQKKAGEISEDEFNRMEKRIGEMMDTFSLQVETAFESKQSEIMTV